MCFGTAGRVCASAIAMMKNRGMAVARDFIFVNCQNGVHDWQFTGGRNASCERGANCCCSVPVHECATCRDCDYGENEEARTVHAECRNFLCDTICR